MIPKKKAELVLDVRYDRSDARPTMGFETRRNTKTINLTAPVMAFDLLSEFLDVLADNGELLRITDPVDSVLEVAEITRRTSRSERGAVVFCEQVTGSKIPLVANLLGTDRRFLLALGVDSLDEIAERITAILQPSLPSNWLEALQRVPRLAEVTAWPPQVVERALSQQVVKLGRDVNLAELPVPRCWPGESLPVITAGQVFVEWPQAVRPASSSEEAVPESATPIQRHVTRPLIQVRDRQSLLMHWTPHDPEWRLIEEYRALGRPMPIAVSLGGDPLLTYAAGARLPAFVDALVFAGFLRRKPVEVVRGRSIELLVPARAEFILEGLIDPHRAFETAPPVGLPTGYYSLPERIPVMTVTALTHRANPVFPTIVLGPPSDWDVFERASEVLFRPLLKLAVPEVVAVHLPAFGRYRNFAFVSIQKAYPYHARKVLHALWGLDRFCTTKFIVVVDADVDVCDESAVWFAVGSHAHPSRDTVFTEGLADMLDHATPLRGVGSRLGFDATRKLPEEGHPRDWPQATE